jgi:hypothetical protein
MKPTGGVKGERVEIRVENVSDLDLDRVRAHFPDGEVDYGPVPKGAVTAFRSPGRAYRYAGFSVEAGGRQLSIQPMDYMGEKELPPGRYSYALGVDHGLLIARLDAVP